MLFHELKLGVEASGCLQKKPRHPAPETLELVKNYYRHILPSGPYVVINITESFQLRILFLFGMYVTSPKDNQRSFLWH